MRTVAELADFPAVAGMDATLAAMPTADVVAWATQLDGGLTAALVPPAASNSGVIGMFLKTLLQEVDKRTAEC